MSPLGRDSPRASFLFQGRMTVVRGVLEILGMTKIFYMTYSVLNIPNETGGVQGFQLSLN